MDFKEIESRWQCGDFELDDMTTRIKSIVAEYDRRKFYKADTISGTDWLIDQTVHAYMDVKVLLSEIKRLNGTET